VVLHPHEDVVHPLPEKMMLLHLHEDVAHRLLDEEPRLVFHQPLQWMHQKPRLWRMHHHLMNSQKLLNRHPNRKHILDHEEGYWVVLRVSERANSRKPLQMIAVHQYLTEASQHPVLVQVAYFLVESRNCLHDLAHQLVHYECLSKTMHLGKEALQVMLTIGAQMTSLRKLRKLLPKCPLHSRKLSEECPAQLKRHLQLLK
jgi:hypothetical protein